MPAPNTGQLVGYGAFLFPVMQAGLTRRVSLGLGTPAATLFCGCVPVVLVAPKVQLVNRSALAVAAGSAHVITSGADGGYAYLVSTVGSADAALTLGVGRLYARGGGTTVLTIGAERRLTPRVVWVTENYAHRHGVMTSGGFRVHGSHWSVDLALGWFIHDGVFVAPMLNVARSF
jgi:hypothetical protein